MQAWAATKAQWAAESRERKALYEARAHASRATAVAARRARRLKAAVGPVVVEEPAGRPSCTASTASTMPLLPRPKPVTTAMIAGACGRDCGRDQCSWQYPLPVECLRAFHGQPGRQSVSKVASAFCDEHSLDAVRRTCKKSFPQNAELPRVCGGVCRTSASPADVLFHDDVVAALAQAARRLTANCAVLRVLIHQFHEQRVRRPGASELSCL